LFLCKPKEMKGMTLLNLANRLLQKLAYLLIGLCLDGSSMDWITGSIDYLLSSCIKGEPVGRSPHFPVSLSLSSSEQWSWQDKLHSHGRACNQCLPKPTCPGEYTSLVPLLLLQFKPLLVLRQMTS
jgi:hypothetical protein